MMSLTNDTSQTELPPLLLGNQRPMEFPGVGAPPGGHPPFPGPGAPPEGQPLPSMLDVDAILDQTFYDWFELVANSMVINALCLLGSIGNILCIYILFLHGFAKSTNVILVSLAIADLMILLTLPLRKISLIIKPFDQALAITVESYVVCYHLLTLNRVWSLTSNAHVAFIAVERFLAVYFPFQVSRWTTVPRVAVTAAVLHSVFFLLLIPNFSMFEIMWIFDKNLNQTIAIPMISPFFMKREKEFQLYNSYFVNLFLGALFLSTTVFCCICISVRLFVLSKKRKMLTAPKLISSKTATRSYMQNDTLSTKENPKTETDAENMKPENDQDNSQISGSSLISGPKEEGGLNTNAGEKFGTGDHNTNASKKLGKAAKTEEAKGSSTNIDRRVVKMLLIVCLVYLVLIFPTYLFFVFQEVFPQLREPYWHRVNFLATTISMFLITLNSSLNFVIYVANSPKFFGTFKRLIGCNKSK